MRILRNAGFPATHIGLCVFISCWALIRPVSVRSQAFGKNQVTLRDFDWKIYSTQHFDIHHYDDSKGWVPRAAEILERAHRKTSAALDDPLEGRFPFFLYANVNDFQQSTIVEVGDGTGGVTEAFKNRFMVFNDGTEAWLDDVATHEFGHVAEFHLLLSGFWKSVKILKTVAYPLWLMEGFSEYVTGEQDRTMEDIYLRDASVRAGPAEDGASPGLLKLVHLHHVGHLKPHQITLAYKEGSAAMRFLEEQYGPGTIAKFFRLFKSRLETSLVLSELVGLDAFEFDRKFREYLTIKYRQFAAKENLAEPSAHGTLLTRSGQSIPEFNTSPVFSRDGRFMAYFSTRDGYPPGIYVQELREHGSARPVVRDVYEKLENISLGNFTQISRNLAISPDGKKLAFGGQKNHRSDLYLYDLETKRLSGMGLEEMMTVAQPSFSPDGKKIAFSGMKKGYTDIFLLEMASHEVSSVTQDDNDDQSPFFSPDGKSVVYSSEVTEPDRPQNHERHLFVADVDGRRRQKLLSMQGAQRDPVFSTDGTKIAFAGDHQGVSEIYEVDLLSGETFRLTRTIGGNFTPIYLPNDQGMAFSSFRMGSIHIYAGTRAQFLKERVTASVTMPPYLVEDSRLKNPRLPTTDEAPSKPARFSASTDIFLPAFFYSTQGGLFLAGFWQASDMLGRHNLLSVFNYNSGVGFLNYQAAYQRKGFRTQWAVGADGLSLPDSRSPTTGLLFKQRFHRQFVQLAYPFDRFHRFEMLGLSASEVQRFNSTRVRDIYETRMGRMSLVRDTSNGKYLVANQGGRLRLDMSRGARVLGGNQEFWVYRGELHKFISTGGQGAVALRLVSEKSTGGDPQIFELGGIGGVRGFQRTLAEKAGAGLMMGNFEWRFPLVSDLNYYMWYLFPDFYFKAIFGTIFYDAGFTWNQH
ncbi:MAG: hypothetical protein A3G41_02735, partial [Elusimicrobia bacterium RIFCSPLOWO2_12_FULL_59_9]